MQCTIIDLKWKAFSQLKCLLLCSTQLQNPTTANSYRVCRCAFWSWVELVVVAVTLPLETLISCRQPLLNALHSRLQYSMEQPVDVWEEMDWVAHSSLLIDKTYFLIGGKKGTVHPNIFGLTHLLWCCERSGSSKKVVPHRFFSFYVMYTGDRMSTDPILPLTKSCSSLHQWLGVLVVCCDLRMKVDSVMAKIKSGGWRVFQANFVGNLQSDQEVTSNQAEYHQICGLINNKKIWRYASVPLPVADFAFCNI